MDDAKLNELVIYADSLRRKVNEGALKDIANRRKAIEKELKKLDEALLK